MIDTIHLPLYAIRHAAIGGTEFAIYNLARGLAEAGARLHLHYGRDEDLSPDFLGWARSDQQAALHRHGGLPGPKGMRFLEEAAFQWRRRDRDWALFPNYFCPPARPLHPGRSAVILHDIQYRCLPHYHSRKRRLWLDAYLPTMFRSADAIILISRSEQALVRAHFGDQAADRCDIVPNAIDFGRLEMPLPSDDPVQALIARRYLLSVCHQFPHKNVRTLLRAFAALAEREADLHLYLVGAVSPANRRLVAETLPDPVAARVRLTGFVSDAQLGALYRGAALFALPSLYEGFGMPAAEALGLGVPTIVSAVYALPEVTRGHAGLIDRPEDPTAWASAIEVALGSGDRPTEAQRMDVRQAYDPATIAQTLLGVLERRSGT